MHCHTARGQWAVQLLQCTAIVPTASGQWNSLQCTATMPGGSGQCNSCNALPHCLGAMGSGTPAMHCHTSWRQWVVELVQCTTMLSWGSGQLNSCNALPHCLGAVGSATALMHCLTACGQWAVELLQCTATLPRGSGEWAVELLQCTIILLAGNGKWKSCSALPHCLRAVGRRTPAMHRLSACGPWAVQLLQCTASLPGRGPTSLGDWESRPGGGLCLESARRRRLPPSSRACQLGGAGSPAQEAVAA